MEYDINQAEENYQLLTQIADALFELDIRISQNSVYFEKPLYHPGIISFEFISKTLLNTELGINGVKIQGVLRDNFISENEIEYLKQLRDDIESIVEDMVSPENPPQSNNKLSISEANRILGRFYSKWSKSIREDSLCY